MRSANQVREKLRVDDVSVRRGVYTAREGFFYTCGRTEQHLVRQVLAAFPDARVVESGEVWRPFRGGAPLAKSSHWFVKFTLPQEVSRG